ncbi:VWA domain-containing protein [Cetobacterium sp.]|uniref:VWA domain-containing protein n=1 Tax=Cetobacterium sp. TaxID=2071632 RepID=UPI002FC64C63
MFSNVKNLFKSTSILNPFSKINILAKVGIKCLKTFIDYNFREKVIPVEGSVVYSDLYFGVEHSGIYIGNNEISNIVVDSFAESSVKKSSPENFTDKSFLYKKIYVSCNSEGAVGDKDVSNGAITHLGERGFYGLIFKNCHEFSEKCVEYSKKNYNSDSLFQLKDMDETWERSIRNLKAKSKKKLGVTKWKLWDWKNQSEVEKEEEPDLNQMENFWKNIVLNKENIKVLRNELGSCNEYIDEIADESLPKEVTNLLTIFKACLETIDKKYQEVESFINITGCGYSYNDLIYIKEDFLALVKEMEKNQKIKEVIKKLGKNYISNEKKLKPKVLKRNNNEILGIYKSDDLARILTSELTNFESEELEYLFYSKFLEKSLLTYEIVSKEHKYNLKEKEEYINLENKGPVIACLDTSGSMNGDPILKAKALLLSVSKILEKENRNLYIIIFGDKGETKELNIHNKNVINQILPFLSTGFGGGTDFETPLKKGINIIKNLKNYNKADILMITDGLCELSDEFIKELEENKLSLEINIYTIMCSKDTIKDKYSDEVINI